ncbi:GNAT family N-acetyltransferase [Trichothermofontia sichuanensis B231]|uniref:GNAT family N-acetyltransferase n=1 Tax=Trichothermofontia sichuanensis TaxID=3045816 RepID=UPI00224761C5|nr:GNAT family N-acetyltransferase [Trichothermofontia sichuanensis]UZQ54455.1 GNAT family N-acetyltransferase [Trichothermofontia sichuanensis B231]
MQSLVAAVVNASSTSCEPEFATGAYPPAHFIARPAQPGDVSVLADILAESFHPQTGWLRLLYPLLRWGMYEDLRSRLYSRNPYYTCLVAVAVREWGEAELTTTEEVLVGTIEMTLRTASLWQPQSKPYLYLSNLAVRAPYRRRGAAQHLLQACEQVARDWGFADLYLHVLDNNQPAKQLYFKLGYHLKSAPLPLAYILTLGRPQQLLLHKRVALECSLPQPHCGPTY